MSLERRLYGDLTGVEKKEVKRRLLDWVLGSEGLGQKAALDRLRDDPQYGIIVDKTLMSKWVKAAGGLGGRPDEIAAPRRREDPVSDEKVLEWAYAADRAAAPYEDEDGNELDTRARFEIVAAQQFVIDHATNLRTKHLINKILEDFETRISNGESNDRLTQYELNFLASVDRSSRANPTEYLKLGDRLKKDD